MERSTQYTSFSSRKQPANAGSERKQSTENASVALQHTALTHAHTKCPPVYTRYEASTVSVFLRSPVKLLGVVCTIQNILEHVSLSRYCPGVVYRKKSVAIRWFLSVDNANRWKSINLIGDKSILSIFHGFNELYGDSWRESPFVVFWH